MTADNPDNILILQTSGRQANCSLSGWQPLGVKETMTSFVTKAVIVAGAGLPIIGCSRGPALSPDAAAQLAAKLVNEQCGHLYQQQPFNAAQHSIVLRSGKYEWGTGFDPVGPGGFSTLVNFRTDGSAPYVEVYFSCDPPFFPRNSASLPGHIPFYPR
ncbi:MAG TPA: hypothetical protein VGY56_16835 [Verrucomicrobiae bacterium]|nr:hypothetical protein [Verrucomicrobiae bacterium]